MHGEYKVPGGKFVRADFGVSEGKLTGVSINGDFFLDPPEALDGISASLEGVSSGSSEDELAGLVKGSLSEEVEMIGFSPEDVAIAVKRGLSA